MSLIVPEKVDLSKSSLEEDDISLPFFEELQKSLSEPDAEENEVAGDVDD